MADGKGARLAFEGVNYTVRVTKDGSTQAKALLKDVSASVESGRVLAVLGPSGAGKTTLLNTLTLQHAGGTPSGTVRVDGAPLTAAVFERACSYVEQQDALWASLTAREHLEYAVALFRPELDAAARAQEVARQLTAVGLDDVQDVKAGSEIFRGLSSGNKRRLSVALALVKEPSVLFLDEPTSGVDSASAIRMMGFLKEIAAATGAAVLCTIHQPPASVFADFDNAMVLSMGRVAYFGKAARMGEYLASIGSAPGEETNVAEFVLDLVNKDFTPVETVVKVLDAWDRHGGAPFGSSLDLAALGAGGAKDGAETPGRAPGTSFGRQVSVLADRAVLVARREPLAYLVRLVANFFATLFFGIIYIKTRDKNQEQIQSRTFFMMFCMGIPMQFILVSNFIYFYQWLSLKREVKGGMYHPIASAIASWVVQVPMMFILALSSLIPMYAIGDLAWVSFPIVLVLYAATFWAFEGLAQLFSPFPNVLYGLFLFLCIYFTAFLFCGMFVDPEDVIWPIRVFCYFLPLGWSLQSYMYALYHDLPHHSGTMPCTPGEPLAKGGICTAQGFYCWSESDPTGAVCYGKTGDEILRSLSVQFTIFEDEGHYARNIALIVAFGALCRIGYVAAIYVLTKVFGGDEIAPLSDRDSQVITVDVEEQGPDGSVRGGKDGWEEGAEGSSSGAGIVAAFGNGDAQTVSFAFQDIAYSIPEKEGSKEVLKHVSASVSDGEVLAIVGPTGAGKTILLDTLTFSKGPGKPMGKILLNGSPMTHDMFIESAIYVPREDNLWPTLTPRQHVDFAFKMYRPELDAGARGAAVDELLRVTGMTSCQDTMAGGAFFRGLSGGQRRRLTLAVGLVKQPRVMILDEPTSGLDSAAASAIISLLGTIAKRCSTAVVCTIHQPSAIVFSGFTKALVLAEGRVAYCGGRGDLAAYFNAIGKPLSKGANPAEAVLNLVSKDTTSPEEVGQVLDTWAASEKSRETAAEAAAAGGGKGGAAAAAPAASAGGSTLHVVTRQISLAVTDPLQYTGRLVVIPFIVSFFGVVYVASHGSNQKQVPFRLFYLWWVLALPACLGIVTVIGTNRDVLSVVYEIRAGMYATYSYVLSTSFVQAPALFLLSVLINVCSFGIGGWPWDNFITFVLMYAINLWIFDSFGQLLAVVFRNPVIGMLAYLGVWSSAIVFCGLVFRGGDVVWPFRSFFYGLPLKWLFNSNAYDVYKPGTFDGAKLCEPGSQITSKDGSVYTCTDGGFYCEGAATSFGCWGHTGEQVLKTLHMSYESIDSKDERLLDLVVLVGMLVALKLGFAFTLWRAVSASDSPQ